GGPADDRLVRSGRDQRVADLGSVLSRRGHRLRSGSSGPPGPSSRGRRVRRTAWDGDVCPRKGTTTQTPTAAANARGISASRPTPGARNSATVMARKRPSRSRPISTSPPRPAAPPADPACEKRDHPDEREHDRDDKEPVDRKADPERDDREQSQQE